MLKWMLNLGADINSYNFNILFSMGDTLGFLKVKRKEAGNRPVHERIYDFSEVEQTQIGRAHV